MTRILHLSDLHATATGRLYDGVEPLARLDLAIDRTLRVPWRPDVIVLSGDLVQRGQRTAYRSLAAGLAERSASLGLPILTVLGNHDQPDAALVLPGHEGGHDRVVEHEDVRFVLLDSHRGTLGPERLDWLARQLSGPAIVVLHHPPLPSPLPALADTGLQDADAFAAVIAGSTVRAVLCGHFHHALAGTLAGVPVFAAPALAYRQSFTVGPQQLAGVDLGAASLVDVDEHRASATELPLDDPAVLFRLPVHPTPGGTR